MNVGTDFKELSPTMCYSFKKSKFDIYNNMMMKRSELFLPFNSANNYILQNKFNWVTLITRKLLYNELEWKKN